MFSSHQDISYQVGRAYRRFIKNQPIDKSEQILAEKMNSAWEGCLVASDLMKAAEEIQKLLNVIRATKSSTAVLTALGAIKLIEFKILLVVYHEFKEMCKDSSEFKKEIGRQIADQKLSRIEAAIFYLHAQQTLQHFKKSLKALEESASNKEPLIAQYVQSFSQEIIKTARERPELLADLNKVTKKTIDLVEGRMPENYIQDLANICKLTRNKKILLTGLMIVAAVSFTAAAVMTGGLLTPFAAGSLYLLLTIAGAGTVGAGCSLGAGIGYFKAKKLEREGKSIEKATQPDKVTPRA